MTFSPDDLAVILACAPIIPFPSNKVEMLTEWTQKSKSVKTAYLRRARRLLKTWASDR